MRNFVFGASLLALAACTQPAVTVDNRGTEDFSRHGGRSVAYNVAAPVAPVTYGNQAPSAAQPAETVAPLSASIAVNELQPAAGKAETKIEAKPAPKTQEKTAAEPVALNAWTGKARDVESFAAKPAAAPASGAAFIWPVASHDVKKAADGITIAAANGEPVWASADGEVVYADSKMAGYGKMVIVKHAGGKTTTYAHMARYAVEKYDRVKQGDIIGYVGRSGNAKTPQLYFSMRDGTKAVDPQKYLDRKVAGL